MKKCIITKKDGTCRSHASSEFCGQWQQCVSHDKTTTEAWLSDFWNVPGKYMLKLTYMYSYVRFEGVQVKIWFKCYCWSLNQLYRKECASIPFNYGSGLWFDFAKTYATLNTLIIAQLWVCKCAGSSNANTNHTLTTNQGPGTKYVDCLARKLGENVLKSNLQILILLFPLSRAVWLGIPSRGPSVGVIISQLYASFHWFWHLFHFFVAASKSYSLKKSR